LSKVEEQVEKDKENAQIEKKELYQTRRTKQDELKKLEFKIDMAELVNLNFGIRCQYFLLVTLF